MLEEKISCVSTNPRFVMKAVIIFFLLATFAKESCAYNPGASWNSM